MSGITLTYGECAENHAGMERIGEKAIEGFDIDDLKMAKEKFEKSGCPTEIIELNAMIGIKAEPAYILIVKRGATAIVDADLLLKEQSALVPDKKALMRGRVVNKHARHNLCFDEHARNAHYEQGLGTIIAFADVPLTDKIRKALPEYLGEKCLNLKCEANYYYDLKKCYIGYHGDSERRLVVGVRLGGAFPLYFRWYHQSEPISDELKIDLEHGDLYVMSAKAVGTDWKTRKTPTLRHAAGAIKNNKE